jgi:hypothetical protein
VKTRSTLVEIESMIVEKVTIPFQQAEVDKLRDGPGRTRWFLVLNGDQEFLGIWGYAQESA